MPQHITKRGSVVYLNVNGEWYQYDEASAPIGSGAMGVVFLGFHSQSHLRVAIKMVRQEYANIPVIRQRAIYEASLMFMHPNLIEMIGYCEWAQGVGPIWIVSKFVQGITIDKFLMGYDRRQKGMAQKICNMFLPVLDALYYLHTSPTPILHLDIKPSNIMIENGSNVRLMDLGIASTEGGFRGGSRGMMGTPNYAAPEQFGDDGGVLNESTDIYEAGVTLYELLSKSNPFDSGSLRETIDRHRQIVLPSCQWIPSSILQVLRKATSPDQSQRYAKVMDFKRDLKLAMHTPQPSISYRFVSFIAIVFILVISVLIFLYIIL